MAKSKNNALPYVIGEKGVNRVRLYAHPKTGVLWLDCRTPARMRRSLGHRDVERGKRDSELLAAKLREAEAPRPTDVTQKSLFDMYERGITPRKSSGKQAHDRRAPELFERCWGSYTKIEDLDRRDWDRFIELRRRGDLRPPGGYRKGGARDRQVEIDLRILLAVIHWDESVRVDGRVLVEHDPFKGFSVPSERNPRRPSVSEEEYAKLRVAAAELGEQVSLFLVLAHETGHRGAAIRHLRLSDFDGAEGRLRWRAEFDKMGLEHFTPLSAVAVGGAQV